MKILLKSIFTLILLTQLTLHAQESSTVLIPKSYYLDQVVTIGNKGYLMILAKGTYKMDQGSMLLRFYTPDNKQKWEAAINKRDIDKRYEEKKASISWSENAIYLTCVAAEGSLPNPKNEKLVVFRLDIGTGMIQTGTIPIQTKWGDIALVNCTDTEIQVIRKEALSGSSTDSSAKIFIQSFEFPEFRGDKETEIEFPAQKPGKKQWQTWIFLGRHKEQLVFYKKYEKSYQVAFIDHKGKLKKELFISTGIEANANIVPATSSHYNQELIPRAFDIRSNLVGTGSNSYVSNHYALGSYSDIYFEPSSQSIYITGKVSFEDTGSDGIFFLTKYNMNGEQEWHKKYNYINYKFPIFSSYDFYVEPVSNLLKLSLMIPAGQREWILDEYNFNDQGDSVFSCQRRDKVKTEKSTVKTKTYYYYTPNSAIKSFYVPGQLNAFTNLEKTPNGSCLLKARELAQKRKKEENPFYFVLNFPENDVVIEHLANLDQIILHSSKK